MKKLITTAAAAIALAGASASATVLDFANYADTFGERGTAQGETLTVGGVDVRLFAVDDTLMEFIDANPYLDAGNAGLGMCSTGLTSAEQCVVPGDDNVTSGEGVAITFEDSNFDVNGLTFRGANHALLGQGAMVTIGTIASDGTRDIRTDSIGAFVALAAAGDAFFSNIRGIGFGFAGDQFYLSQMDVDAVPVPAAGLLFLTGAAGLAFKRSRAKA